MGFSEKLTECPNCLSRCISIKADKENEFCDECFIVSCNICGNKFQIIYFSDLLEYEITPLN